SRQPSLRPRCARWSRPTLSKKKEWVAGLPTGCGSGPPTEVEFHNLLSAPLLLGLRSTATVHGFRSSASPNGSCDSRTSSVAARASLSICRRLVAIGAHVQVTMKRERRPSIALGLRNDSRVGDIECPACPCQATAIKRPCSHVLAQGT